MINKNHKAIMHFFIIGLQSLRVKVICSLLLTAILSIPALSQVNLQTGSATFSLPLFNWQDHASRLTSVVALDYNSGSGLKVDEFASNVGQGWNLITGGVISRLQQGEPDDQPGYGNASEFDLSKYPPGKLYATVPIGQGCPEALAKYPLYKNKNQIYKQHNLVAEDRQLDYFVFQFNGRSGMFILDPASMDQAIMLGDSKMKITYQRADMTSTGTRTTITSFTIQDIDGITYKFDKKSRTKVLNMEYCDENLQYKHKQPKFHNGRDYHQTGFDDPSIVNPWIVSGWYLTEISDPLSNRVVSITYGITTNLNKVVKQSIARVGAQKEYISVIHYKSKSEIPEITSIQYPDGHLVEFEYGADRIDMAGQKVLSEINVKYNSRFLSKYFLNTKYAIRNRMGTPVTVDERNAARLYLKSVRKLGVDLKDEAPPHIFNYYMGSNNPDDFVPPPLFYAKDIWGFYNGDNSKDYFGNNIPLDKKLGDLHFDVQKGLCFLRQGQSGPVINPKDKYARNGLLKEILFPTGGSLIYEYAQNKYDINGTEQTIGGVHVSKTLMTDGGFSNDCSNPLVTEYKYIKFSNSKSSLWGYEAPVHLMETSSFYEPEVKKYKWTIATAPFGQCVYEYMYPGILSTQQVQDPSKLDKVMKIAAPILGALSLASTISNIVTYATGGSPVALIIDAVLGLVTVGITCLSDLSDFSTSTVYYNHDLNSANPLPMQFSRVEVIEGDGSSGKTVYEFTSGSDYPVWHLSNPKYTFKQRYAPWAYGLPKRTVTEDANGEMVTESINEYDTANARRLIASGKYSYQPTGYNTRIYSCNCVVEHSESQRSDDWNNSSLYSNPTNYTTTSNGNLSVDFYVYFTGRMELVKTTERQYAANDDSRWVESQTEYQYSTSNYEVTKVITKESSGDEYTKEITYCSYSTPVVGNVLMQNNILGLPETISTRYKSADNSVNGLISQSTNQYFQHANGDIKPSAIKEIRYIQPGVATSSNVTVQEFYYDGSGNLKGLKDEGQRQIANIYGHNDKFAVASVINADPVNDKLAYADFEEGFSHDGWTLNAPPNPVYSLSAFVSGKRAMQFGTGYSLTMNLGSNKDYTLSLWSSTTNVTVSNGAVQEKLVTGINGFNYFEFKIPANTATVSVQANGILDEVRLYPRSSLMRTISYDPLIGKLSECNENNKITYYEYDDMGRLKMIRDEEKNILKSYEYNAYSKQRGCESIFYNKYTEAVFIKECGPGYEGTEVTYIVPANKYTSTISQDDADAKVEFELLSQGQLYANANGQCKVLYCNTELIVPVKRENCSVGYSANLNYIVPAGRYCTTVSQAEADAMAQADADANAIAWAEGPENANACQVDTTGIWINNNDSLTQCLLVNGSWHKYLLFTNINPNSPSYNSTRWESMGPDTCSPPSCTTSNCNGEGYKCVNGTCEFGIKVYTHSQYNSTSGFWECYYHYEWSDGSWSFDYMEITTSQLNCPVMGN